MTTTLSDEEFQRLNDQLLNLKAENYNLEVRLQKCSTECNLLRNENNELKRSTSINSNHSTKNFDQNHPLSSPPHLSSSPQPQHTPPQPQPISSIKQKLNPFALAKSIASKVDSRIQNNKSNHNEIQQQQQTIPSSISSGNISTGNYHTQHHNVTEMYRLESQESDFIKTNDMLKNEIGLLQSTIELLDADKKFLLKQISESEKKKKKTEFCDVSTSTILEDNTTAATAEAEPMKTVTNVFTNTESLNLENLENQRDIIIDAAFEPYLAFLSKTVDSDYKFEFTQKFISTLIEPKLLLDNENTELIKSIQIDDSILKDFLLDSLDSENNCDINTESGKIYVALCNLLEKRYQSKLKCFLQYLFGTVFRNIDQNYRLIEQKSYEMENEISKIQSLNEDLENQLNTARDELVNVETKFEKVLIEKEEKFSETMESVRKEYETKLNSLQETVDNRDAKLKEKSLLVESLEAKILESVNEHKISEKRGLKIIKEFKKELSVEKNRANRLQARLQELLNSGVIEDSLDGAGDGGGRGSKSNDSTTTPSRLIVGTDSQLMTNTNSDRCSSSGSWSYMNEANSSGSGNNTNKNQEQYYGNGSSIHSEASDIEIVGKIGTVSANAANGGGGGTISSNENVSGPAIIHHSPSSNSLKKGKRVQSSTNLVSTNTLEHENAHLVTRISNLQQEKWRLDEQVNQLEHETRRLAEELALKNKLIQHYCIDGHRHSNPSIDSRSSPSTPSGGAKRGSIINQISPYTSPHSPQQPYNPNSSSLSSSSSSSFSSPSATTTNSLNNSVLRVVGFLKEKGDDLVRNSGVVGGLASIGEISGSGSASQKQLAETNRKLQRMVEEILTKNMHLQADLELLSNQVMALKSEQQASGSAHNHHDNEKQ